MPLGGKFVRTWVEKKYYIQTISSLPTVFPTISSLPTMFYEQIFSCETLFIITIFMSFQRCNSLLLVLSCD